MSRIGLDPDQLRGTVAVLRQGRDVIQQRWQNAIQAMQAMQGSPWAGQHRGQVEDLWARIQVHVGPLVESLERLAARTERLAGAFEEVGQHFRTPAEVISGGPAGPAAKWHANGHGPGPEQPEPRTWEPFPQGSTRQDVLNNTAGCTTYVLSRLNLDAMQRWPHAHEWNEAARAAQLATGHAPLAGSVMVFEPGVLGADSRFGHVAYVEQVTPGGDGTVAVTISEASLLYNANGDVVWGAHTPPTNRKLVFTPGPDGALLDHNGNPVQGVSFIYGRSL